MKAVLFFILCVTGSVIVNRFISYLSLQRTRKALADMLREQDFGDIGDDLWEDKEDTGRHQGAFISTTSWSNEDILNWLEETYPHKNFILNDNNTIVTDTFKIYCDIFRNDTIHGSVLTMSVDADNASGKVSLELVNNSAEFFWNDVYTQPVAAGDFVAVRDLAAKIVKTLNEKM